MGNYVSRSDILNWPTPTVSYVGPATFTGDGLDDFSPGGAYTGSLDLVYVVQVDGEGTPDTVRWSKNGALTWEATTVAITGSTQNLDNGVTIIFGNTTGHTLGTRWHFTAYAATGMTDAQKDALIAEIEEYVETLLRGVFYKKENQTLWLDGNGTPLLTGFPDDLVEVKAVRIGTTDLSSYIGTATFTGSGLNDLTLSGTFSGGVKMDIRVQVDGTGTPDTFKVSIDGGKSWKREGVEVTGAEQDITYGVKGTFGATTGHILGERWDFSCSADWRFDARTLSLRPVDVTEFPQVAPSLYTAFPKGYRNVMVLVDIGKETVPSSIKRAVKILVEHRNEPSSHEEVGFTDEKVGDVSHGRADAGKPGSLTGIPEADKLLIPFIKRRMDMRAV